MSNKEDLKKFGKALGLMFWGLVAVASSAESMNSLEGFYVFCGLSNLLINGFLITKAIKKFNEDGSRG